MKVEIDLPEIEGYEYTGEYRSPEHGEAFIGPYANLEICVGHVNRLSLILREKRWRAEMHQKFWMIDDRAQPVGLNENLAAYTARLWETGNYFQTKEEAEAMAEKVRALFGEGL